MSAARAECKRKISFTWIKPSLSVLSWTLRHVLSDRKAEAERLATGEIDIWQMRKKVVGTKY
jgi:hypothetical protein